MTGLALRWLRGRKVKSMDGKLLSMDRRWRHITTLRTHLLLHLGTQKNTSNQNKGKNMKTNLKNSPKIIYKDHILARAQSNVDCVLVNVYEHSKDLGFGELMLANVTIQEAMATIDEVMADMECSDVA